MRTNAATETMTQSECWSMLGRHPVGRLGVAVGDRPDIFPINYVVDGDTIVFKTAVGTKFAAALLGRHVAFEIDGEDPDGQSVWSVVVKGTAHEVAPMYERFDFEDLPLYPWVAVRKPNYVQIVPSLVSGRRFRVVDHAAGERSEMPGEYHPGAPKLRPG